MMILSLIERGAHFAVSATHGTNIRYYNENYTDHVSTYSRQ
jgi:hypothetical protein